MDYSITAIGHVVSSRKEPLDDHWDKESTHIVLDTNVVGEDAAVGLDTFSHVEVIYLFHKVPDEKIVTGARRPRNNPDWPLTGILAQRAKNRLNKIGATICEVVSVDGSIIHLHGLDAIDGSPVIDLKPVMTEFLPRSPVRQPEWTTEVMQEYWS